MRKILYSLIILLAGAASLKAQVVKLPPERKLAFAEQIIASYYVDTIDTTKVVEDAIIAMLKDLDPQIGRAHV